jgi:hypothetical protein
VAGVFPPPRVIPFCHARYGVLASLHSSIPLRAFPLQPEMHLGFFLHLTNTQQAGHGALLLGGSIL